MSPEKFAPRGPWFVPGPIKKLIGCVIEVVHDTVTGQLHVATITEREKDARLEEQKMMTHVSGMTASDAIKRGAPSEEQVSALRLELDELPPDLNLRTIGLDEEQLGLLSEHFDIPPAEEE